MLVEPGNTFIWFSLENSHRAMEKLLQLLDKASDGTEFIVLLWVCGADTSLSLHVLVFLWSYFGEIAEGSLLRHKLRS